MKDEARHIQACVDSVRAVVDEVVVYDTGSTDGTQAIADAAGAIVVQGDWYNDFARARNEALAHSSAEWVLSIDADERLDADRVALRELTASGTTQGIDVFAVHIRNLGTHSTGDHDHLGGRLMRRQRILWTGALHEHPARRDGMPVVSAPAPAEVIRIEHLGYADAVVLRVKADRNRGLAEAALLRAEADQLSGPELARLWLSAGQSRAACGDPSSALEAFAQVHAISPGGPEADRATEALIEIHLSTGRADLVASLVETLGTHADQAGHRNWLLAQSLVQLGREDEALELLRGIERVVDLDGRRYDLGAVRELHAHVAFRRGQRDEAVAALVQAMVHFGRIRGRGLLLMSLWGTREVTALATLLAELAGDTARYLPELCAELQAGGQAGAQVADAVVAILAGGRTPVPAARRGYLIAHA